MVVEYNTVIIGSGIAGMTAGIYLRRAGIKILIIENDMPGGELNKASSIENYPGYDSINGSDLAMNIYNQLLSYDPEYLFEEIKEVKKELGIYDPEEDADYGEYQKNINEEDEVDDSIIVESKYSKVIGYALLIILFVIGVIVVLSFLSSNKEQRTKTSKKKNK